MKTRPDPHPFTLAIVSPHRDDAAFSCGLLIQQALHARIPVTIANLFTQSSYAPFAAASLTTAEVTSLRLQEDEAYLTHLGPLAELLDFHLEDFPIRHRQPANRTQSNPLDPETYESEVAALARSLGTLRSFSLVCLPLAIGNHIDHRLARDAGQRALPATQLAFYEDLPYAAAHKTMPRPPDSEPDVALVPLLLTDASASTLKTEAASFYPSQVEPATVESIAAYAAALSNSERLYLSQQQSDLLQQRIQASKRVF